MRVMPWIRRQLGEVAFESEIHRLGRAMLGPERQRLESALQAERARCAGLQVDLVAAERERAGLRADLDEVSRVRDALASEIDALRRSLTWRAGRWIAAPIDRVRRAFARPGKAT